MRNRNYIGKAKEGQYGTLRVNIKMSDAEKFIREYKDEKYLTFYVSKMQEVDKLGNSHTAYCLDKEAEQQEAPAAEAPAEKPKANRRKQAATA